MGSYDEGQIISKWGKKWQSSYINCFYILFIGKNKFGNIYYIIASAEGKKNDFEFSKDWSYNPDWTDQDIDVDEFAAITHVMNQFRNDYPYLHLLGIRRIQSFERDYEIKEFVSQNFPMVEISTKYGPSYHDGIIEWPNNIAKIVDLGNDGEFIDFAELIWSHKSVYAIYFLFSKTKLSLGEIKKNIESAQSIAEYENVLVKLFDICLIMNYGEGWMDILSGNEDLVRELIKPYEYESKTNRLKRTLFRRNK